MSGLERFMEGIVTPDERREYQPSGTKLYLRGHHITSIAMNLHGTPWTQPKFGGTNLLELYTKDPDATITIVSGAHDSICGVCAELDGCKGRPPAVMLDEKINDTGVALGFGLLPGATYQARELLGYLKDMDKTEIWLRSLIYSVPTLILTLPLAFGILFKEAKHPGWFNGREAHE